MMKHHSNYSDGGVSERYGPYTTAYNRFNRWRKAGVWDRPMDVVTKAHGGEVQMIDSSIVRVHQHASGVKKERVAHKTVLRCRREQRAKWIASF